MGATASMISAPAWASEGLFWVAALTALITFVGLVRAKVWRPLRVAIDSIQRTVLFVEGELKNNGGKTIRDVTDRIDKHVSATEARIARLEQLSHRHELDLAQAQAKADQVTYVLAQHANEELARYSQIVDLIVEKNHKEQP